ncbi:hypothetical protein [Solidesulfovibrio sp. C21]|uniref:hypothetical protein n=1 Tax=Solidesulfovibrio sp. C21 TaxID=3398613 RepID=UPI0039FBC051
MMRLHRAVLGLLGPVFRSSSGSTLLWMIGALVVLGSVAAGVALMSPSASRGKLEQEAGMRAYYNANAGLQFLNSANDAGESAKIDFSNFTSRMGGTGVVTYTMPDNGAFSYQLGNLNANGVNGTYQITNLIGTVQDVNDKSAYSYVIYGGGKGESSIVEYTPQQNSSGAYSGIHGFTTKNFNTVSRTTYDETIVGKNVNLATSVVIGGDVISSGDTYVGSGATVKGLICSNGDVETNDKVTIYGPIRAQGNVKLGSSGSVVKNDIYAKGDVEIGPHNTVEGNIHAGGKVTLGSPSYVLKNVYAGGSLDLGSSSRISKNAYVGKNVSLESASYIDVDLYADGNLTIGQDSTIGGITCCGGTISGDQSHINKCAIFDSSKIISPTLPESCEILSAPRHADSSNFPSSGQDKTVPQASSLSLVPGTYGKVSFQYNSTLKLTAGVYHFVQLDASNSNLKLYLDISDGDITIFITKNVQLGYLFTVYISDGGEYKNFDDIDKTSSEKDIAAKSYLETMGSFTFASNNSWIGTIYAKGNIDLGYMTHIIGAMFTSDGSMVGQSDVTAYYVESNYARDNWVGE